MSTHVTLKVVGTTSDPSLQQVIRVKSGPTVDHAREEWGCGVCSTYTSKTNTYRVISKTCNEHACLIPKEDRREPDDEDRAELADLLGADMVGKLLDDKPNGNPNRGWEQR